MAALEPGRIAALPGVATDPSPQRGEGGGRGWAPSLRLASPWLNRKLLLGGGLMLLILLLGLVGPLFWDRHLAFVASSPTNLPPMWVHTGYEKAGTPDHPLGTESNGRDMLAVLMVGAISSLQVGLIAAGIGIVVAMVLGSLAGYLGGPVDDVIRTLADTWITIPPLAVLIVISSFVRVAELQTMALLLALFAWPGPTRLIRSQVLSLRERGYVQMARLSGCHRSTSCSEMMPNMLPYLAASFTGNVSANILAATAWRRWGWAPRASPRWA